MFIQLSSEGERKFSHKNFLLFCAFANVLMIIEVSRAHEREFSAFLCVNEREKNFLHHNFDDYFHACDDINWVYFIQQSFSHWNEWVDGGGLSLWGISFMKNYDLIISREMDIIWRIYRFQFHSKWLRELLLSICCGFV